MSEYLVLARKYRSSTFGEVVGQDHVSQTLINAIQTGRIAHAYLFTGTRGVGKTTMARIMAKSLNCMSAEAATATPCNKCDACISISRGDDVDVVEIDGASNRGIEEIRQLRANAIFRPSRCRYKIYYIDEVHMLTKEAFNALLKTLEEPPEHVKFIFATTEVEKIPGTILSRCQRFDFRNIPTRQIADHLANLCKAEKVSADASALFRIAKAAAGSMRDGLSLMDQVLAASSGKADENDVIRLLGVPADERTLAIASAIVAGDAAKALSELAASLDSGVGLASIVNALCEAFRNIMLASVAGADSDLVELPELQKKTVVELSGKMALPSIIQAIGMLSGVAYKAKGSAVARALVEAVLVRLAAADKFIDPASLIARLDGADTGDVKKNLTSPAEGASPRPAFAPATSSQAGGFYAASTRPAPATAPSFAPKPAAATTPASVATQAASAAAPSPSAAKPTGGMVKQLSTTEKQEILKDSTIKAVSTLFGAEMTDIRIEQPTEPQADSQSDRPDGNSGE